MDGRMWVDACMVWRTVHAHGCILGRDDCVDTGFGLWTHGCVDTFGFAVAFRLVNTRKRLHAMWRVGIMLGSGYGCAMGCIKVSGLGCADGRV